MTDAGRYDFSLCRKHVWRDLFSRPRRLFGAWGVKKTLRYMFWDTIKDIT